MAFRYFYKKLDRLCKIMADDKAQLARYSEKLENLNLSEADEFLLTQLVPPDQDNLSLTFDDYQNWLAIMRGETDLGGVWWSKDQIVNLKLTKDSVDRNLDFLYSAMQSIYFWSKNNHYILALAFINKIDEATDGRFFIPGLSGSWDEWFKRILLALFTRFYGNLDSNLQFYILNTRWLVELVLSGADLSAMAKSANEYFVSLTNRDEFCVKMAGAIGDNDSFVYNNSEGDLTVAIAVLQYRSFCDGTYTNTSVVEFLQTINWPMEIQAIMKEILDLYTNLILENVAYIEISVPVANALGVVYIKEEVEKKYHRQADGTYDDMDGVLKMLDEKAKEFKQDNIKEFYFFDEKSGKFKWLEE